MCGICGVWNVDGRPVDPELLGRMRDSLAHRGPDGAGTVLFDVAGAGEPVVVRDGAPPDPRPAGHPAAPPSLGLAHRRLSIIDLETGDQPMCNEHRSVWVVFNGEIYNYRQLRQELRAAGHVFRTASDTEVIVHAYEAEGVRCMTRFNGIFAFALWDVRARRLLLARDHFGVKPLYYTFRDGTLRFASEIKAILADPGVARELDPDALNLCLTLRHTPAPWTLFRGIAKLPPASRAVLERGQLVVERYWHGPSQAAEATGDERELTEALATRLECAVEQQMVSDVPISLSLSSGVDSSALLALMARHSAGPVRAFTVGFAGREDESEIGPASATARRFGADFSSRLVSDEDYAAFLDAYIWHLEEPVGNESAPAYHFVARMARERGVKVLLNGQGPDETFAGYTRHLGAAYGALLPHLPAPVVASGLAPLADRLPLPETGRRLAYALGGRSEAEQLLATYGFVSPATRARLLQPAVRRLIDPDLPRTYLEAQLRAAPPGTRLERMLYVDTRTSLPDNLLLCEDKMAMAAGVEARVPFLDLDYMALAERVPGRFKVRRGRGKYLHRRVCARLVPSDVARRPKIGFTNAVDLWLRARLGAQFRHAIAAPNSFTTAYLDPALVGALLREHLGGRRNHQRLLFLLLSLEAWWRTFIRA
jgi:asparagine synthase (glutamine-hydrolysing)